MAFRDIKDDLRAGITRVREAQRVDDVLVQYCYDIIRGFAGYHPLDPLEKKRWFKEKSDKATGGTRLKAKHTEGWAMAFRTPTGKLSVKAEFQRGVLTLKGKHKFKSKKAAKEAEKGKKSEKAKKVKQAAKTEKEDDKSFKVKVHLKLGDYMEKRAGHVVCKDEAALTRVLQAFNLPR